MLKREGALSLDDVINTTVGICEAVSQDIKVYQDEECTHGSWSRCQRKP